MDSGIKEQEIKQFAIFLLKFNHTLTTDVFRGNLTYVMHLYNKFIIDQNCKTLNEFKKVSVQEFREFLNTFNGVSNNALGLKEDVFGCCKINWINYVSLILLKDSLTSGTSRELDFKVSHNLIISYEDPKKALLTILSQPLHTKCNHDFHDDLINDFSVNPDLDYLDRLLKKKTARHALAKEKIKLKTIRKQFYEICDDSSHTLVLTAHCFPQKDAIDRVLNNRVLDNQVKSRLVLSKDKIDCKIYKCYQKKTHFLPIIGRHTDLALGDCSYLDTCHKIKTCRYLHYYTLKPALTKEEGILLEECKMHDYTIGDCISEYLREHVPSQWINCDVRYLPFLILGKFAVILADPAWDIHMSLPYGTCKDQELLSLPIHELQDEGIIMLWVTGRSIEVGRKALQQWGYVISDEMIWIKLNQLKRTIVTGRTGHWLNHSKEHLLVGIKGNPYWINRQLDVDLIVSGTRETSRKPDEIYDVVERIVGYHSRKLEIFGRDHNIRPGWLTIGNQILGTSIYEEEIKLKYDSYISSNK